jgi:hypothetical protein
MATLAEATAQLAAWEAASLATATGKSYSIADRQLTRNNAEEIMQMINHWQGVVNNLTASANGSNKPASLACWNNCT